MATAQYESWMSCRDIFESACFGSINKSVPTSSRRKHDGFSLEVPKETNGKAAKSSSCIWSNDWVLEEYRWLRIERMCALMFAINVAMMWSLFSVACDDGVGFPHNWIIRCSNDTSDSTLVGHRRQNARDPHNTQSSTQNTETTLCARIRSKSTLGGCGDGMAEAADDRPLSYLVARSRARVLRWEVLKFWDVRQEVRTFDI